MVTVDWALPHKSLSKKIFIDLPPGKSDGDFSQLRFSLPRPKGALQVSWQAGTQSSKGRE